MDLAELVTASPVPLPAGRLITPEDGGPPAYWLSDDTPDSALVAALRAHAPATGLQPVLLSGSAQPWAEGVVYRDGMSSPDAHHAGPLLTRWWHEFAPAGAARLAPFGADWPGLAWSGAPGIDPDRAADTLAAEFLAQPARLALVAAASGAHTLPVLGWWAAADYAADVGEIAAVVQGWQDRFGVRVVCLGTSNLYLSVARPPRTIEHARRVAAEHYAFCPDQLDRGAGTLEVYADRLIGATTWSFWWD